METTKKVTADGPLPRSKCKTEGPVELFPYQENAANWLASQKIALLAFEMGLGKSAISIRACELVGAKRVLVICRAIAIFQWKNEFKKFSNREFDLYVTSYESLKKLGPLNLFDVLICDESHYVKEPDAQRTQLVLGKIGVVHRSKQSWFLSGTPTPNHNAELWPLLFCAGRTSLSYGQFVDRYCKTRPTKYNRKQIVGNQNSAELRKIIQPFCFRQTKEQVLKDLPPIFFQDLVVPPGKVELGYSQDFTRRFLIRGKQGIKDLEECIEKEYGIINSIVDGKHLSDDTIKAFQLNAQSISTVRRYVGLQKVQAVAELVTEELQTKAYPKIVLFTWHRDITAALERHLKKFNALTIYGGTDPIKLALKVKQFQEWPNYKVLIANFQTAGTSITLTAANQVMFVEQSFVPADMQQALMRLHRIGQEKSVFVRYVGLQNSIDQHIAAILKRKTQEITELMDGLEIPRPMPQAKKRKWTAAKKTIKNINDIL